MSESEPSWGIRINQCHQPRDADTPEWANPGQRTNWRRRGLVVWDSTNQQIAHLHATHALEILKYMDADTHWGQYGFGIGTPVVEIDVRDPDAKGVDTLSDRITLNPDQCAQLRAVLQDNQSLLERVKEREEVDSARALSELAPVIVDSYLRRRAEEEAACPDGER